MARVKFIKSQEGPVSYRSNKVIGYRLPDVMVEELIESGIDDICFVEPSARYTISLDDWIEYRVWSEMDQWQHVSRSFMSRG